MIDILGVFLYCITFELILLSINIYVRISKKYSPYFCEINGIFAFLDRKAKYHVSMFIQPLIFFILTFMLYIFNEIIILSIFSGMLILNTIFDWNSFTSIKDCIEKCFVFDKCEYLQKCKNKICYKEKYRQRFNEVKTFETNEKRV